MARDVLFRTLQLGIVVGCLIGGSIYAARYRLPLLFSSDPRVQTIAAGTLPLLSVMMVNPKPLSSQSPFLQAQHQILCKCTLSVTFRYTSILPLGMKGLYSL